MSTVDVLYEAIDADNIETASKLLSRDNHLVNARERTPPPIHWAIYKNRAKMVEILLDSGADIELKDQDREATPLEYAIVYGRKDIIPLLIHGGANVQGSIELAERGASGEFEKYADLPPKEAYVGIIDLLRRAL